MTRFKEINETISSSSFPSVFIFIRNISIYFGNHLPRSSSLLPFRLPNKTSNGRFSVTAQLLIAAFHHLFSGENFIEILFFLAQRNIRDHPVRSRHYFASKSNCDDSPGKPFGIGRKHLFIFIEDSFYWKIRYERGFR